ncbi:MAG: family 16 glycosylhydrolase [Dysgonomonas sp.]
MRKYILLFTLVIFGIPLFAQDDYVLMWSDEFNSEAIDTQKWSFETGGTGWGNKELQFYTARSENAYIKDGKLIISALKEDYQGKSYTSARLITKDKAFVKYGKIEARIKLPQGKGTWPAFWMMPQESVYGSWPRSGEIDIMEHVGSDPTMISYAVHTQQKNGSKGNNWYSKIYPGETVEQNFHDYSIEWLEDRIVYSFDGEKQVTLWNNLLGDSNTWPFDQNFFIIINIAIGGNMGGTVDDGIFNSPVQMEVDYVRIYQKTSSSISQTEADKIKIATNTIQRDVRIQGLEKPATISLMDMSGKGIMQLSADSADLTIDAALLQKGVYVLKIDQQGEISTHKIII